MSWVHHTIITPSWISAKKDLNFKREFCDFRRALGLCWKPFKILNPKGGGDAAFVLQSKITNMQTAVFFLHTLRMTTLTDLSKASPKMTGESQSWRHCSEDPKAPNSFLLVFLLAKIYIKCRLVQMPQRLPRRLRGSVDHSLLLEYLSFLAE